MAQDKLLNSMLVCYIATGGPHIIITIVTIKGSECNYLFAEFFDMINHRCNEVILKNLVYLNSLKVY